MQTAALQHLPDDAAKRVLRAAHAALLVDRERLDAAVALRRMLQVIADTLHARCAIWGTAAGAPAGSLEAEDSVRVQVQAQPADGGSADAALPAPEGWPDAWAVADTSSAVQAPHAVATPQGDVLRWPLLHLGEPVGILLVAGGAAPGGWAPTQAADLIAVLEPAAQTAAALLAAHRARGLQGQAALLGLVRAALHQSHTFVWDWDIAADTLGDIDEGERMLGYPPGSLGHTQGDWDRIIHPDDAPLVDAAYDAHVRGEMPVFECVYRARAADGQWRWIEERGRVVAWSASGQPSRMLGAQADVTQLKELETARQQREVAETASRAKSQFLSRVSHELRTPLHAVLGFAQLIDTDTAHPLAPDTRRWLSLLLQAGRHLNGMIDDLLDLAQVEAGQLRAVLTDVALAAMLRDCADLMRPQAEAAQVVLAFEPPDAALCVRADPQRLRQVLLNLLSNAIKYNRPTGRVTLRAAPEALDGQPAVRISVEDTGVGIGADQMPRLYEAFDRLGRETGAVQGIGLGLALSQSLVALMGGRLRLQSEPGIGSIFSVLLPAPAPAA